MTSGRRWPISRAARIATRAGIGFFGLSKGGGAGLMAAAHDNFVRCFVTDGIFATVGTMVPYMKHWVFLYVSNATVARLLPGWYLRYLARLTVRRVARERRCHYPSLQKRLPLLAPRPFLMIHGGADKYIKPEMARALFELAREPKEFWLVAGAKHNQAFHVANDEYRARLLAFFDKHLGNLPTGSDGEVGRNGTPVVREGAPRAEGV